MNSQENFESSQSRSPEQLELYNKAKEWWSEKVGTVAKAMVEKSREKGRDQEVI